MAGNRDFLIGRRFARATGCGLLPDPCLADLYGQRTLLTHGDLLCSDDRDYQRFRRRVRNPLVRWLFLLRGLERRRAIAANYRRLSQTAMADKPLGIMDANQDTICAYLRRYGSQRLIHGHTHRPAQHQFPLDGQTARRWVLADWRETSGEVLVVSAAGTQVETLT
jgi:UDP-2,3-diacylglucosamine hydrolase